MEAVKASLSKKTLLLGSGLLIIFFAIVAIRFSFVQSIWVDESTQLSGLTLPVLDIYRWLGGLIDHPFLVPADRMPPLGYVVGVLWSSVFGLDVLPMRYLSLALVLAGLAVFFIYFKQQQRYMLLMSVLLLLCLSANLVVVAVEIRSYALFFLLSVIASVLYFDLIQCVQSDGQGIFKKVMILSAVLALAMMTHFFGFLLCGSILGSYLVMWFFDKRFVLDIKIISGVSLILAIGIVISFPAIYASFVISEGGGTGVGISSMRAAVKLVYRLVAHQSLAAVIVLPLLVMVVVYGSIVWSLYKKISIAKIVFSVVLVLGLGVAFLASLLTSGFDALAPHYNIWALPFLAVLLGLCVEDLTDWQQKAVGVILLVTLGVGQVTMLVEGRKFTHTRFNEIQAEVMKHVGPDESRDSVVVIYNEPMAKTWFAGLYAFPESVGQYIATNKGYLNLRTREEASKEQLEAIFNVIIAVYGEDIYSAELVASPIEKPLEDDSPVYHQIQPSSTAWDVIATGSYMAQESADIVVYRKSP